MPLTPGTRFGPYEVLDSLGAGGMGEVYRARDTKLGRDVAIKVLPDAFTADVERLTRFEREARTLASLNHPNIAQIYGMEGRALVMELCPGEDLAAIAKRGAIPVDDALPIARQIAAALAVAHEAGVIHRDLKPANIKVAPDGAVKVLDFGLAKALDASASSSTSNAIANSPTITSSATKFGVILGTAAYMSPEQARGKPVDRRADVWAFGVVLYEMLAGRRAFRGDEVSDVLASVLKDSIALEALPADTPVAIRRLLRRCLEKDRSLRLDSMTAARLEIEDAIAQPVEGVGVGSPAKPVRHSPLWWTGWAGGVVAALALAAFAGYAANRGRSVPPSRSIAFTIPTPSTRVSAIAITSSDGAIVYEADRLYVKTLSDPEPRPLAGTEGSNNLFLSTDGRWAGFYVGGKIKKVLLAGGDPLDITSAAVDSPGAGWGPDNTVVFSSGWSSPLSSVPADGGAVTVISTVDTAAGEIGHWWPQLLPDGKSLLFTIWMAASGINDSKIAVLDLATKTHRIVMQGADARYLPTGHLVFFRAGGYATVPFDLATLRPTGDPRAILPDARPLTPTGNSSKMVAVGHDGTLAYVAGKLIPETEFAWVSPTGTIEAIELPIRPYGRTSMSPDGRRAVSVLVEGGKNSLYLLDLVRRTDERLDLPGSNLTPVWSPSGDFIAYTSMASGHFDAYLFLIKEGRPVPVIVEPYDQMPIAVSPNGKRLVLVDYLSDGSAELSVADIDLPKDRRKRAVPVGETNLAVVSPDGRWIAVQAWVAGRVEIVVQPFPHDGPTVRASSRGGNGPVWSRTGSTLYYRRGDELIAATWSSDGGRFAVTSETSPWRLANFNLVGQAPDGRFLVMRQRGTAGDTFRVITNWFDFK